MQDLDFSEKEPRAFGGIMLARMIVLDDDEGRK